MPTFLGGIRSHPLPHPSWKSLCAPSYAVLGNEMSHFADIYFVMTFIAHPPPFLGTNCTILTLGNYDWHIRWSLLGESGVSVLQDSPNRMLEGAGYPPPPPTPIRCKQRLKLRKVESLVPIKYWQQFWVGIGMDVRKWSLDRENGKQFKTRCVLLPRGRVISCLLKLGRSSSNRMEIALGLDFCVVTSTSSKVWMEEILTTAGWSCFTLSSSSLRERLEASFVKFIAHLLSKAVIYSGPLGVLLGP